MAEQSKAELAFREAFERLKCDAPVMLRKGAPVSQNNVAKEAGYDPSALRKSRYPTLIFEIQRWIVEHGAATSASAGKRRRNQREHNRSLRDEIKILRKERDAALSLLVETDSKILELVNEIEKLKLDRKDANVMNLKRK